MSELGFWLRHLASGLRPSLYQMSYTDAYQMYKPEARCDKLKQMLILS